MTSNSQAVFAALSPSKQGAVLSSGRTRRYASGQLIAARGDVDGYLSFIEAGEVRVSNVDRHGRQVVTTTLRPGDSFGEFTVFARMPRRFDFHAVGSVAIREIPRQDFRRLMDADAQLRDDLLEALARKLLAATDALDDMRQLPLTARTAKLLLRLTHDQGSSARWIGTQTELADTLGVTRVAAGHALGELRALALIRTGYRRIDIPSVDKLHAWLEAST